MSDALKHECGIAHIRLLKPLDYYKKKYGTTFYGINKMYLLMEKQHNRGQDGAGFASIKFDVDPGERYISRVRSIEQQPIQDVFSKINNRINDALESNPLLKDDVSLQKKHIPYIGEVMLYLKDGVDNLYLQPLRLKLLDQHRHNETKTTWTTIKLF